MQILIKCVKHETAKKIHRITFNSGTNIISHVWTRVENLKQSRIQVRNDSPHALTGCWPVWFYTDKVSLKILKRTTPLAEVHLRFDCFGGGVLLDPSDFFFEADFRPVSFSSGSYRALLRNRAAAPLSRRAAFFFSVISFTLFMHILILSW